MEEKSKSIEIKFEIKNFGPLNNLDFKGKTNSLKMGIFANNGVGKTFFSRALRLASPLYKTKNTNNLLTTNQTNGKFIFKITNENDPTKIHRNLEILLNENSKPTIKNDTRYLFHVFNSDYIAENLESYNYQPNDNIKGYILGKSNIDVSVEQNKLNKFIDEQKLVKFNIENNIEKTKKDLDELGINKNINEYKRIDFENLINNNYTVKEDKSFKSLRKMQKTLEEMPDSLNDVKHPNYTISNSVLEDVTELLSTSYEKSNLKKSFIKKLESKLEFIEDGMELYSSNIHKCPFCEQDLSKSAIKIIKLYESYIEDSETKIIKNLNSTIKKLENLKLDIRNHYSEFNEITIKFNDVKQYLPSHKEVELKFLDDNTVTLQKINELIKMLNVKKSDITSTNFKFENLNKEIKSFLEQLRADFKTDLDKIDSLNKNKNDKKIEKRELNRELCKARYLILKTEEKTNVERFNQLTSEIEDLQKDIKEKENQAKIDRREEVIKSLKDFLNYFFKDKYKFDPKTFSIIFKDERLYNKATHVLSDGEKSIVAFCYYLATSHLIIGNEEDYNNLFFIIDDPVSSMDFNFVYAVTDIITHLGTFFNHKRTRFIILTHNLDFMNLLMSNNIIHENFILRENDIERWNEKLMLPYENHLIDIIKIADGKESPSHTTPNSIRHVLETICKFENRNKSIIKFMSENPELKKNKYINVLMQDLSHGRFRSQSPPNETINNACKIVVKYLENNYKGQIEGLR
ncbi:MAG TPA: AAA family ATPase [Methanobacterium subterraneum]|uniref:AAA family ATPase n=1 Tax=Methanobacterium subterraneum TaxID=59277 RepID=A0A7J4TI12_9EURY|nr:AAA family ATPase [Methanobacterium subterraneum]